MNFGRLKILRRTVSLACPHLRGIRAFSVNMLHYKFAPEPHKFIKHKRFSLCPHFTIAVHREPLSPTLYINEPHLHFHVPLNIRSYLPSSCNLSSLHPSHCVITT